MKKLCLFLALVLVAATLSACHQPADNTCHLPSSSAEHPTSSSFVAPNTNRKDELTTIAYHAAGAKEDIYLDAKNCDILIHVAKEADFAPEELMNLSITFNFVIRHYSDGENDFFADQGVQYVDKDGNITNGYVDVQYYLCYTSPLIVRKYKITEGYVYEAASLSEEIIQELKEYFSYLEGE